MALSRLVIAGAGSGVGKTTVSLALMAALTVRGLKIAPFKVGPDYIDPGLHRLAAERFSRNLDVWLMPPEKARALFVRHAFSSDIAIIEGVMGLFDGLGGTAFAGTAHVAALLKAPVLLLVNAEGVSLSAAAMAWGYAGFCPAADASPGADAVNLDGLRVAGVIFNRVSGPAHEASLRDSLSKHTALPCFGCLPKKGLPSLPHRHLGLVPEDELDNLPECLRQLAEAAERHLDIAGLIELAGSAPPLPVVPIPEAVQAPAARMRLGLARDKAFSFYYQDNLDYLQDRGVELVHFSPLEDAALPENLDGLYFGGGFPELFAPRLAANAAFRHATRAALEAGMPAYAECGGMIYLCDSLAVPSRPEGDPAAYPMAGFFPQRVRMTDRLQNFGYVTLTFALDCPLAPAGSVVRAHEFHYSRLEGPAEDDAVFHAEKADGRAWSGGLRKGNVYAAYPHLHFYGCPEVCDAFIAACLDYQRGRKGRS